MTKAISAVFDKVLDQGIRMNGELEFPPNGLSIDLLRAVYRNPSIPLPVRIRCAVAALPHEVHRLAVTGIVNEGNFAELLDRRIKHMEQISNGKTIEAKPVPQIETRHTKPHVNDRRFRRM